MTAKKPKLLERARQSLRQRNYSYRTEQTYLNWMKRFILFHNKRHPKEMGEREIESYLTYLAVKKSVAPSTQNQALNPLIYLYEQVLGIDLDTINALRPRKSRHLPTVLTIQEVKQILGLMTGVNQLIAKLLYGSGLRISECLRLRVKDVDFGQQQIAVRDRKGHKDRLALLPESLQQPLKHHLARIKTIHKHHLGRGFGSVHSPYALARKYPNADREWIWQWVFPSATSSRDPRSGVKRRHHRSPSSLRKAIKKAAKEAGVNKHVTPHVLRHSLCNSSPGERL